MNVLNKQSLFDIALIATGMTESAFEIAWENNLPLDAVLTPGVMLIIPKSMPMNKNIRDYYTNKSIVPATAISAEQRFDNI